MPKLTMRDVRSQLRPLGLKIGKTAHGEFRVSYTQAEFERRQRETASDATVGRATVEDSAYYTNDIHDALATGLAMAASKKPTNDEAARKLISDAARAVEEIDADELERYTRRQK